MFFYLFQQATNKKGLPCTNFASDDNESFTSQDGVIEVGQRLIVPRCWVDEMRVRTDLEGITLQMEKGLIHSASLAKQYTLPPGTPRAKGPSHRPTRALGAGPVSLFPTLLT